MERWQLSILSPSRPHLLGIFASGEPEVWCESTLCSNATSTRRDRRAPQPASPWTDVKDVDAQPNWCPQIKGEGAGEIELPSCGQTGGPTLCPYTVDNSLHLGAEDCLYLHVW